MDRPIRGVAPGGVAAVVGAACRAVADHLAADGRPERRLWLERGDRLRCVAGAARAGAGEESAPATA